MMEGLEGWQGLDFLILYRARDLIFRPSFWIWASSEKLTTIYRGEKNGCQRGREVCWDTEYVSTLVDALRGPEKVAWETVLSVSLSF